MRQADRLVNMELDQVTKDNELPFYRMILRYRSSKKYKQPKRGLLCEKNRMLRFHLGIRFTDNPPKTMLLFRYI